MDVAIMPISIECIAYAQTVHETLTRNGINSFVDLRVEKIGMKIRDANAKKIPYVLVVGAREAKNGTVAVRKHGIGDQGIKNLELWIKEFHETRV
jgi:threonyl-tRNA synthetase